jgi:hypothetical protein
MNYTYINACMRNLTTPLPAGSSSPGLLLAFGSAEEPGQLLGLVLGQHFIEGVSHDGTTRDIHAFNEARGADPAQGVVMIGRHVELSKPERHVYLLAGL